MKIRRYKKVTKHLSFFVNNFAFRQPYQLLVDGTFCYSALQHKVNIADNIPRYLHSELKLLTTQCVILEMEKLGHKVGGALVILKKYAIHKCGHEKKPVTGSKCLLSMVGDLNSNHYIVATQDWDLQSNLQLIPGVPVLYLHSKTPVFKEPSQVSIEYAKDKLAGIGPAEKEALTRLKIENGLNEEVLQHKKKRKKGANPLSCKKKKNKIHNNPISKTGKPHDKDRKKRKKIKIPAHVKVELLKHETQTT